MSATSTGAGISTNSAGQTVYSGFGGSATSTSSASGKSAASAIEIGQAYGLMIIAGSLFGGFALLL